MSDHHVQTLESPAETPLLDANQIRGRDSEGDTHLDKTLRRLEMFLTFLGFKQSSVSSFVLSWVGFVLMGIALPVVVLELLDSTDCESYQIKDFELDILALQACLATVSLLCLSHNLRKYGIRKFLFVDRYSGQMTRFRKEYVRKISDSMRLLVFWLLPCLALKTAREVVRFVYVHHDSWWVSVFVYLALILSWTYVSTISLAASVLFHLVCNLQVIHFEDYGKLLEKEGDVCRLMEEHIRLRFYLSKISHRFRIYLLLEFLVVTASQFITLVQTTGYSGTITFINGGDFAVSSMVQVVGITICLHAATKISHRAQGIASISSRWHALVTCAHTDASPLRVSCSVGNLEAVNVLNSLHIDYSESDLESLDCAAMSTNAQMVSLMSSHHKRQAFVMYLQNNHGGITIFGWTVDRALINTIFCIELSLVTFVLGKTLSSSS